MTHRAALVLLLALVTTSCGSGDDAGVDPAKAVQDDFAGGTCLVIAPDVLAMRRFAVLTLREDPAKATVQPGDVDAVRTEADLLRQATPRAGGALEGPLGELVAALDATYAALDGGTYDDGRPLITRVRDAADGVVAACT